MAYQPLPGGAALKFPSSTVVRMTARDVPVIIEDITDTFFEHHIAKAALAELDWTPKRVITIKNYRGTITEVAKEIRAVATGKIGLHVGRGAELLTVFLENDTDGPLIKMFLT